MANGDLGAVTPTGPGGRLTEDDVRSAARGAIAGEGRREKVRGVRRQIVEHLGRAHREVPADVLRHRLRDRPEYEPRNVQCAVKRAQCCIGLASTIRVQNHLT